MKGVPLIPVAIALLLASVPACRSYPLPATPGIRASDHTEEVGATSTLRLKPSVCAGQSLEPDVGTLSAETFVAFLKTQGFNVHLVNERADLIYVDVEVAPGKSARLRVAVLSSPELAGEELRKALGQQGKGSWGVHRSNIAILAPVGHVDNIVAFSVRTRLACWGVLTIQGGDDPFVVPGGYLEF